ncbi:GNAT family N-acetyltransferase [Nocardioides szechwanensis]|uniref:GNAT family N-acetyltransferase n=1 Tax=Nocardioides szechwanensis TaxID=1005944 RepID=UPI001C3F93CC|nr:GNAT family N-acetyltransferase [Nocardioides szechwanensis]
MTDLAVPDPRLLESWAACVRDFDEGPMDGSGDWHLPAGWRDDLSERGCRVVVDDLLPHADATRPLPDDRVPCDYYWVTDGDPAGEPAVVVGFLALRHRLNAFLLEEGGHIGYSIRPARRQEGHASRALSLAVRRAADLGLDRVLVTCDETNEPSRRTIESNGGRYEDSRKGKRRYWIDTGA